jgi:Zn-dependent M28 family amino/carboxypeptidase
MLAVTLAPRDVKHGENLERAAEYVRAQLAASGGRPVGQTWSVDGATVRNVGVRFGPEPARGGEIVVVGAHYDSYGEPGKVLPGADDNASGVAGLIELAALLRDAKPAVPIELVAYSLEEPPYFRTEQMGSAVHVRALANAGLRVRAMLSLEMIGCFLDEPGSQRYPAPVIGLCYPSRGDFVAVVGALGQAGFTRGIKRAMAAATPLPVRSINAPRFVPGIDWSDHLNYWNAGFDAVMVTDTAFCRNDRYHGAGDTVERLDFRRMADVVRGVDAAVVALAR